MPDTVTYDFRVNSGNCRGVAVPHIVKINLRQTGRSNL